MTKEKINKKRKLDYSKLKISELKEILKEKKLPVSGNKSELIERLTDPNWKPKARKTKNGVPFYDKPLFQIIAAWLFLTLWGLNLNYQSIKADTPRRLGDGSYTPERDITEFTSEEIIQIFTYDNYLALIFPFLVTMLIPLGLLLLTGLLTPSKLFASAKHSIGNNSFFFFYIASFLIPIAGIIIGAIFLVSGDKETKKAGQTCVGIGVASIILGIAIMALIFSSFSGV